MEGYYGYRLLLLIIIVLVNAFFAAAEVSLVSTRPSRLRALAAEGVVGAQAAISLLANPERLLSVTQFGVTIATLGLGWAGEQTLEELLIMQFQPWLPHDFQPALKGIALALSFGIMTFFHVVIGEVVPKNIAIEEADRLAILSAPPLLVFSRISGPMVSVLERSAAWFSRLLGVKEASGGHSAGGHSAEEIKYILSSSRREGALSSFTEGAMQHLIALEDYLAREIMVPRNQMVAVSIDTSLDHLLRVVNEHQYTRVPVYEGRPEQLIGYVNAKDLLRVWEERRLATEMRRSVRPMDLRKILRKLPVVPESKPVVQLLDEFRKTHNHMVQVVDEFGTTVGVVTLEDLVEQVFGEIEDEYDARRAAPDAEASVLRLEGTTTIRDLELQHSIVLPAEGGYETLAGFVLFRLGHIPMTGESVVEDGRLYTVEEMDRNRIARVRIEAAPTPPEEEPSQPSN